MNEPKATPESRPAVTRRSFVAGATALAASAAVGQAYSARAADSDSAPHQATGTRVGEVTADSAVVWTRMTVRPVRNGSGMAFEQRAGKQKVDPAVLTDAAVDEFQGACPGLAGQVRLRYGTREDFKDAVTTDWAAVNEAGDFIHQFRLTGLQPASTYHYASETAGPDGSPVQGVFRGRFETAPPADQPADVRFCVMTCQGWHDRGHPDGHPIYPSMLALKPQFAALTGDLVYYDNDAPQAVTPRLARYHWERMFSLPRLMEFTRNIGTYWLKDDHDTLNNDSWPGRQMGDLTFAAGQTIFREQAPMSEGPSYRTFRWGHDLQIWLTDGRDYRSPNKNPDGPDKTIWGAAQKAWFKRTVSESDATWKVLISPTPFVGPDKKKKNDNHVNPGFQNEGDQIRGWLKAQVPDNFFVVCGDRHWQYHSVHPQTGLNEFSVGPASDEHADGASGRDPQVHKFYRPKGGFLSVEAGSRRIAFRLHDVDGNVVYKHAATVG